MTREVIFIVAISFVSWETPKAPNAESESPHAAVTTWGVSYFLCSRCNARA